MHSAEKTQRPRWLVADVTIGYCTLRLMLKQDLVIAVHRPAYDAVALWTVVGNPVLLKITDQGLRAIGIDPNERAAAPSSSAASASSYARWASSMRPSRASASPRSSSRRARHGAPPTAETGIHSSLHTVPK